MVDVDTLLCCLAAFVTIALLYNFVFRLYRYLLVMFEVYVKCYSHDPREARSLLLTTWDKVQHGHETVQRD
jgi:hypothetical protein